MTVRDVEDAVVLALGRLGAPGSAVDWRERPLRVNLYELGVVAETVPFPESRGRVISAVCDLDDLLAAADRVTDQTNWVRWEAARLDLLGAVRDATRVPLLAAA